MIPLEQLEDMFQNIRAKSPSWNINGDMLWGYFFTDPDPRKLDAVKNHLVKLGYHYVNLYPTDDNSTYVLHVEKTEHHTPQSLYKRNAGFYRIAEQFGIALYDGMDVGPAGK